MSSKVELLWSPNKENEFATYGNELKIYAYSNTDVSVKLPQNALPLSSRHHGNLTATLNSDIHCMPVHQCVAWQESSDRPYYFAVGQSSGKVLLANMGLDQPGPQQTHRHILTPRNGRPCTCLAWNPTEAHLLAEGLERSRNDNSLVVWDIERASSPDIPTTPSSTTRTITSSIRQMMPSEPVEDGSKFFEIGAGEATSSLAWLPNQPMCIVAGMGNRFIRMFDIREKSTGSQVQPRELAQHKALLGISVDPQDGNRLASYAEGGTVYLWDIRQFARPVYSFSRSGSILRLSWAPTRCGCLSVLFSEPPYLRLIDLPSYSSPSLDESTAELYTDHLTQLMTDRCPYYSNGRGEQVKLTGVSWHPQWDGRGLLSAENGVREVQAHDKMPISWSSRVDLMFGRSSALFSAEMSESEGKSQSMKDISVKMKERVKLGYGFEADSNLCVVGDDPVLKEVWSWVKMQRELMQKGLLERSAKSLLGVCSVVGADKLVDYEVVTPTTTSKAVSWREREGAIPGETPQFPIYLSKERRLALRLCGWSFEVGTLEDFLKRQEMEDNFERAAAVAVFHGHIRRSITSLKDGAAIAKQRKDIARGNVLNLIALALSGYTPHESKLWRETCYGVKSQISHPYLRATFNFLCSSGRDGFADVLNETEMSLQDRVAFACTYLDDRQLCAHISSLTRQVVGRGDISGLFLTGLPNEGLALLANYVNMTGDVQLACLLSGQVMTAVSRITQVQAWFQGYRDLLDLWQMWHQRALFDGQRKYLDPTLKPARQAFVICNFCSKSIASESLRPDRRAGYHTGTNTGRNATSCPNCRKPLPRCSLCLLNMVATANKPTPQSKGSVKPSDQFGKWFTWCQSCRHGGHANHIAEWFSNHQECPVTACSCQCYNLDS
ncbi:GATOR2 complex protein MIOS-A-like [Halichondria panicea]|uniref:GATOR2 complex protein MIOS-A-like n=1 Tax=Halichondria panicea TaxID=6063 RepID=UPI00312B7047